ncbi:MAG TPA: hypothetical protein VFP92_07765 [Rhodanobacteraceae bacterium]|nr:hypothetical protein [Rhodanobacteraceae bacterium]
MLVRDHVLRGCKACPYSQRIPLPNLSKKIIYLDQFFFSAAFREKDDRFIAAATLIKRATAHQLLLAPYSSVHEDETHQWRGFNGQTKDDLMEFIKATSRGHDFEPAYRIEHDQVLDAFQSFCDGKSSEFSLNRRTALRSDINYWEDYFRIEVGAYRGDIELIRQLKNDSVEELVRDAFPGWRSSSASFDEHVQLEIRDAAKLYIKFYLDYVARIINGDYSAMFDSPIVSMIVQDMMHMLPRDLDTDAKISTIKHFFSSEHFSNIPNAWMSARIFAILRGQVKSGAYANPDEAVRRLFGFFQDVKHISIYAPYVDAIVVDQPMASILNDGRLDVSGRYGTKVFSLNNWDQLVDWLQSLIDSTTDEHRKGLALAYP